MKKILIALLLTLTATNAFAVNPMSGITNDATPVYKIVPLGNGGRSVLFELWNLSLNNAAIVEAPFLIGGEARTGSQPAVATNGNKRQLVVSGDGVLYTRWGGPVTWSCSLDNIGATLTECKALTASTTHFITDITIQSTTATAGQFLIRYGTGSNCGTGTTSLYPAAATVVRYGYPGNAVAPTFISFGVPLTPAAANAICVLCVGTNTCSLTMNGYSTN